MTLTALKSAISNARDLEYSDAHSHHLILVKPGLKRNFPSISVPTDHIFDLLVGHMPDLQDAEKNHLINLFLSNIHTRSVGGYLLKSAVHKKLTYSEKWEIYPASTVLASTYVHWRSNATDRQANDPHYLVMHANEPPTIIKSVKKPRGTPSTKVYHTIAYPFQSSRALESGIYYRPTSPSEPTFDSFFYDSEARTATVFQITVSCAHSVKPDGFRWLRKLGVQQVRYVAVIPKRGDMDFTVITDLQSDPINYKDFVEELWVMPLETLKQS